MMYRYTTIIFKFILGQKTKSRQHFLALNYNHNGEISQKYRWNFHMICQGLLVARCKAGVAFLLSQVRTNIL